MFRMACTHTGKLHKYSCMSHSRRMKLTYNNMHLIEGMRFTAENGFPIVEPYHGNVNIDVVPFTSHCKIADKGRALHFFLDDSRFDNAVWKNLERTTYTLLDFETLFAPDFSLYVDMPDALNKFAVYKSRFAAAYWQLCGFSVIPVASWGSASSFSYCLEGLPTCSIIAVCGVGHSRGRWQRELWHYGLLRLDEELNPTTILVYGEEEKLPRLNTQVVFLKDFIHSRLRKIKQKDVSK